MRFSLHDTVLLILFLILGFSCNRHPVTEVSQREALLDMADSLSHFNTSAADSIYLSVLRDSSKLSLLEYSRALLGESDICSGRSQYDSAALMNNKALSLASQYGDSALIMQVLLARGNLSIDLGDNGKAEKCFRQGLAIAKRRGRSEEQNNFFLALGSIERDGGNYPGAIRIYTEASKLAEKSGNFKNQALALEDIGLTLNFTNDSREALDYIRQALLIRKKNNLLREYAMGLQNLGITYRKLDMLDSALNCYAQARSILLKLNDSNTLVRVIYNTGLVLKNQKKYREARRVMDEVLTLCRRKGIVDGEVYALHTLASIVDEEGNPLKGIEYSDSAVKLAEKRRLVSDMPKLLERKQDLLIKTGNYKEACMTSKRLMDLSDSLLSLNKQKEIAILKTRFETERKESENLLLKKDLDYQHDKMILMWGILGLTSLVFILVLLIFISRVKHLKQNKLLAEERTRLREQELVYQALIRTDLTNMNRSVREKLFPFNLRFQRKKDQEEFIQVVDDITREASKDPLSGFELMFCQLHPSFFEKLLARTPEFTKTELQVCAMIRLNLASKDIARLMNVSTSTVDTTRHHIRKKLEMESTGSLSNFLISL